jgi:hypothetical protein
MQILHSTSTPCPKPSYIVSEALKVNQVIGVDEPNTTYPLCVTAHLTVTVSEPMSCALNGIGCLSLGSGSAQPSLNCIQVKMSFQLAWAQI